MGKTHVDVVSVARGNKPADADMFVSHSVDTFCSDAKMVEHIHTWAPG